MELREQEYVLAIARHGGIKGAAEELNITPPSLSSFLSRLERQTGTPLFRRVGKKFLPTDAGEAYLRSAREMLFLKKQYEQSLSKFISGQCGTLRLGIHPRRTTYLLPAVLREFSLAYPAIDVQIVEGSSETLFNLLIRGEIDIIVNNRFDPNPALVYTPLYRDNLVAVLSPLHPLAGKGANKGIHELPYLDLACLAGERLILQRDDQAIRHYVDRVLEAAGIHPTKTYIIQNMETAAQMAAEGLGVAFNYYSYIHYFSYPRPIKIFRVGDPQMTIDYSIVRRKDLPISPYLQRFIELMREQTAQY